MATRVLTFGGGVRTGTFWFRCFGLGLKLKPPAAPPSFGEQHGLRRLVRLGGWRVCLLLPSPARSPARVSPPVRRPGPQTL